MTTQGCQKISMPNLVPVNLWQQSGRWYQAGPEVCGGGVVLNCEDISCGGSQRIPVLSGSNPRGSSDRSGGPFACFTPWTSTAVVPNQSGRICASADQFVAPKFRDEARPKHGLLRGREFLMKDLYTFDSSQAKAFEYANS